MDSNGRERERERERETEERKGGGIILCAFANPLAPVCAENPIKVLVAVNLSGFGMCVKEVFVRVCLMCVSVCVRARVSGHMCARMGVPGVCH